MLADPRDPRSFSSEIKFLIDDAAAVRIRDWARRHLSPDPNGTGTHADEYRVSTVYLDTARHDVFFRRGSFGRAKYRVRRYGDSRTVFLERKLRRGGYLHKRRTPIGLDELHDLSLAAAETDGWSGHWFKRRIDARHLRPVCEASYSRMARMRMTDTGPLRVTLDEGLQARPVGHLEFAMRTGLPVEQRCVLEVKYAAQAPALLRRFIEDFQLQPQPVSKYRLSVQALGLAESESVANA